MKLNIVMAGSVSGFAIRVLAIVGAVFTSGSWWIAVPAIIVLDWIEGAGRREAERWQRPFR